MLLTHRTGRVLMVSSLLGLSAVACGGSHEPADGPAERAGEQVDESAAKAKEKAQDAADQVEDGVDNAGEKVDADTH